MLKKMLLIMCFLVLLSGMARAEVISEVDDFDKTKYIYSHFEATDLKVKGLTIKNLIFRKRITANNVEYVLMLRNTEMGWNSENRFAPYNDFLIKINNNDNEIYTLPRKSEAVVTSRNDYHEIVLCVPKNVVDKILSSNKITLRIPLHTGPQSTSYKTSIRNIIVDIRENIINEWRQVIQSE